MCALILLQMYSLGLVEEVETDTAYFSLFTVHFRRGFAAPGGLWFSKAIECRVNFLKIRENESLNQFQYSLNY